MPSLTRRLSSATTTLSDMRDIKISGSLGGRSRARHLGMPDHLGCVHSPPLGVQVTMISVSLLRIATRGAAVDFKAWACRCSVSRGAIRCSTTSALGVQSPDACAGAYAASTGTRAEFTLQPRAWRRACRQGVMSVDEQVAFRRVARAVVVDAAGGPSREPAERDLRPERVGAAIEELLDHGDRNPEDRRAPSPGVRATECMLEIHRQRRSSSAPRAPG